MMLDRAVRLLLAGACLAGATACDDAGPTGPTLVETMIAPASIVGRAVTGTIRETLTRCTAPPGSGDDLTQRAAEARRPPGRQRTLPACNGPVVEEGLHLDRAARHQIQAVDHEQLEPCGVRGVSGAVPERSVPVPGAGAADSIAGTGGCCASGSRDARRWCWFAGLRFSGLWRIGVGLRRSGWRRCASASWGGVPGLRRVPGDGGDGGRRLGAGALRGDGRGVSGVRVGDGWRSGRRMRDYWGW